MMAKCTILLLLLYFMFAEDSLALRAMNIRVPEAAKSGDSVTLACDYDLEQAALYTIKWYRGDEEFYRYVPKESPPSKVFPMPHVNVDISLSGAREVTLRGARRELTGDYKCEVSADAPLFHTDIRAAHMTVVELPGGEPTISIESSKIQVGDKIRANCTSPGSYPAANLTWLLNGRQLNSSESVVITQLRPETDQALDLYSSASKLEILTSRSFFNLSRITLSCAASVYNLWHEKTQIEIREEIPQQAPVLGPTASQSHQENERLQEAVENTTSKTSLNVLLAFLTVLVRFSR